MESHFTPSLIPINIIWNNIVRFFFLNNWHFSLSKNFRIKEALIMVFGKKIKIAEPFMFFFFHFFQVRGVATM
jgi:hypothetical protein